jgi:transmembrane sensor
MTDALGPLDELGRLKRHLEPELDAEVVERLVRGAAERRQRRRGRRTLAAGLVLGVVSTTIAVLFLRFSAGGGTAGTARQAVSAAVPAAGSSRAAGAGGVRVPDVLSLGDRSRAVALEPGTELALEEDAPERVHLRLDRGRARFEVTRRPERSFSVRARNVTVSVVGTTFGVEVVADRVGVSVEKGAVEVDWGLGQKRLVAGESGWFPPLVMSGHPEREAAEPARSPSPEPATTSAPGSAARPPASGAQALLAEVDAVRSQGKPARAVELLRQLLREHPDDPRAPLAAFTLGRMLFNELGRPREAAAAFRQVRQKAPASQFAEDALAREVEAWERASEPARARSLAEEYLERYPSGRHARRVKALSGIE